MVIKFLGVMALFFSIVIAYVSFKSGSGQGLLVSFVLFSLSLMLHYRRYVNKVSGGEKIQKYFMLILGGGAILISIIELINPAGYSNYSIFSKFIFDVGGTYFVSFVYFSCGIFLVFKFSRR